MTKNPIRRNERDAANARYQQERRQRKALRSLRSEINAAMAEARRLQRSKKKGTRDFDQNMARLGWKKIGDGKTPELKYGRLSD